LLWKILGFQKRWDTLFNDGWITLGVGRAIYPMPLASTGEMSAN